VVDTIRASLPAILAPIFLDETDIPLPGTGTSFLPTECALDRRAFARNRSAKRLPLVKRPTEILMPERNRVRDGCRPLSLLPSLPLRGNYRIQGPR